MSVEKILVGLSRALGGILGEFSGEKITNLIDAGLWHTTKGIGVLDWMISPISKLEDASPNEVLGYSPFGIRTVIEEFVNAMVNMAPVIGKELVDELIGEMLQEGISNSIQTSLGGALQTLFNIRRGGFPGFQDNIRNYGNYLDKYNTIISRYVASETGLNIITTALDLAHAFNDSIYNSISALKEQIVNLSTYINNYTIGHISRFITAVDVVYTRLITLPLEVSMFYSEIVRRVCEEHLARVNELEDALENIYAYYTGNIVTDSLLIETEMLKIKAELEATEKVFDEYMNALLGEFERILTKINSRISELTSGLNEALKVLYTKLIETINLFNDRSILDNMISNYILRAMDILYGVAGYREINKQPDGSYRVNISFEKV